MSELIAQLEFAWPWIGLLLPLPLVMRFLLPPAPEVAEQVRVPFLPTLIAELSLRRDPPALPIAQRGVFWLIWILLLTCLARPEWRLPPTLVTQPMRNLVLILDVSGSMEKNDAGPQLTRLQAVQQTVRTFVAQRKSDRIGLVIFASSAWPFAPLSEDKQALLTRIDQLTPGMVGQQTAIGDALGVAVKMLDSSEDSDAGRMAILLTDGNDTASQLSPELAAQLAASHHVQVDTIAFGDPQASGEDKVDNALLAKIAQLTGGRAWQASTQGDALKNVWRDIDAQTPAQVKTLGYSTRVPLFGWPLGMVIVLLLITAGWRRLRETRR
ncbi:MULTISPECIES: VWA domain-containing protein [unclassified Pantoea]|uniref:VWA domain-containing protein n=1 Tax=unclassified Pantoea TaxID=2630326 RepID=UPI0024AF7B9F|nr:MULTISPECIES: VWA domain-containing protein [unclassified Pantoea]MDI6957544.1 VWA domain-containing protein [Pantoea sp. Pa-EAmG]MDI9221581.1 VWA domain-containing protein [Pantoea sp. EA-12]